MNFDAQYGAFFRTEQIILAQNNQTERNIFDKTHLFSFYFLLSLLNNKTISHVGRDININSLCFKPIIGKGCYSPSPLDIWKMDASDLAVDEDIQYTAMCINSRSPTSRIPCSDQNEIPIIKESIYGGITCDNAKDATSPFIIPCEHCWVQAKAMLATYLLTND
jgi:Niemann-Pick C1 protein